MPTPADTLTGKSSDKETNNAISACISKLANEHPDWDNKRRVAACNDMARRATGKSSMRLGVAQTFGGK